MLKQSINKQIYNIVFNSFIIEVNALKPGNVSRHTNGHGMTCDDFIRSAELVTPIICNTSLTLGERIHKSVQITKIEIGCNTNLGMLLLFTPIIMSAQLLKPFNFDALQNAISDLLQSVNLRDSAQIFQAIAEANPGGLGKSKKFDVALKPDCNLWDAMVTVKNQDLIAKQYVTGFADVFLTGYPCIKAFTSRWNSVEWAAVGCYLKFLSTFTDTHIARKFGIKVAKKIKTKAADIAAQFNNNDNPVNAKHVLLEFDRELKKSNINPGTSADLTAASVLIYKLESI